MPEEPDPTMPRQPAPTHDTIRDRLLRDGSDEMREEYARRAPRRAAIAALVRARLHRKLTQQELADRMGVSKAVVGRLETGEHTPRLETLEKAAQAMDFRWDLKLVDTRRGRPPLAARPAATRRAGKSAASN